MEQFTAFTGDRLLARGAAAEVAIALQAAVGRGEARLVAFEDATGRQTDFDLRGAAQDVRDRYAPVPRRGRPRLGVTAREVTLLPGHWDWLATQPGGASAALRRLVQAAMASPDQADRARREAAYRVMSALAGDLPGFEEAARALFARDDGKVVSVIAAWPADVGAYLQERLGA